MSANTAKGTKWETALVRLLLTFGITAYKPRAQGRFDVGDIHGLSPFVGQAKDWRNWEAAMREGLDGAEKQAGHANELYGVAFVKRARAATERGYAVTTVRTWALMLGRVRAAEARLLQLDPEAYRLHMEHHAELARGE